MSTSQTARIPVPTLGVRPVLTLALGLLLALSACSAPPEEGQGGEETVEEGSPELALEEGGSDAGGEEGAGGAAPAASEEESGADAPAQGAAPAGTLPPEATEDTRFEPVGFAPMPEEDCAAMAALIGNVLGAEVTVGQEPAMPFVDYHSQEAGQGCLAAALFDGTQLDAGLGDEPTTTIMPSLRDAFAAAGWTEDELFAAEGDGAEGVGGAAAGFRRGADLCLLSYSWTAATDDAEARGGVSVNCAREAS